MSLAKVAHTDMPLLWQDHGSKLAIMLVLFYRFTFLLFFTKIGNHSHEVVIRKHLYVLNSEVVQLFLNTMMQCIRISNTNGKEVQYWMTNTSDIFECTIILKYVNTATSLGLESRLRRYQTSLANVTFSGRLTDYDLVNKDVSYTLYPMPK